MPFNELLNLSVLISIFITIITLARQVIGMKSFGICVPLILSFAFLSIGLKAGLLIFIITLLSGLGLRTLLKHFRLLYLPRLALILLGASIGLSAALALVPENWLPPLNSSFLLSFVAIVALTEKFITTKIEKSQRTFWLLILETLLIVSISCFIGRNVFSQNLISHYPFIILIAAIFINIFLGRWTGLRIYEYWRFREVIKNAELPGKK